ncbi:2-hydroxyacid dehydrogenase [Herbaspirillum sp. RTI4]|uniref:2-hydroxyacid dehydrogenase n=1 Tax=Herbaspirillum sp. RTI4 TaxID=3048640 RepID=UPI002AB349D5|nr:2-hydroxyacid dehydrogenase [Herbaspirillum sp. RTI4]MDY7577645.1 2-hydroxyacid dehydrogenase [Herbaspirillum sp. RTI4]MEA9982189.1 2-hydroxyacid dehydrogenase [Herbaspirillum sp. RTI4]
MKPLLLILIDVREAGRTAIEEKFNIVYAPDARQHSAIIAEHGSEVTVVLTNGAVGLSATAIDALPKLTLICALGVGVENIDAEHARSRQIEVANGAGTNDDCVADHALALLLAAVRNLIPADRACRAGIWRDALPFQPHLSGMRLGILGLGAIGSKIALRGAAFGMTPGYFSRTRRSDVNYDYFSSAIELATWADCLVVATPGGAATRHLIGSAELHALGVQGYLVNIARGSVVDTAALAQALKNRIIAGAGIDVYESEPLPPAELIGLDNVVLTPHVGGQSPQAIAASVQKFLDNAEHHHTGRAAQIAVQGTLCNDQ